MQPEVGAVLEGKVSGVTKFGAFVNLPGGKSGLVHISEIANTFVSDVAQYVSVGQTVKVKVIGINGDKINLSIKRAEESEEAPRRRAPQQHAEQQSRPTKQPQQPSLPMSHRHAAVVLAVNLTVDMAGKLIERVEQLLRTVHFFHNGLLLS